MSNKERLGTETLNKIENWFNNTAYGKRFKNSQERQAALQQALMQQGGISAFIQKLQSNPNKLEEQILQGVSNLPNLVGQPGIDRRISDPLTRLAISRGALKFRSPITQTITPGPPKPLSIKGKSPFANNKVVDTTAYSPVTPKANITQTPPPNVMANRFMKIGRDKVGSTPGAQGATLKIKPDQPMDVAAYDKGMQRQLLKIKPTSDHYWSLASTPPAQFRIGGKTIAFKKKEYMEKGKQQHHLVQKAVSGRVLQRIRALMNDPKNKLKASAKDLEEIHALPMKYGLEAGSGVGALLNMDTKPHLVLHGEHRRGITEDGGYQPGLEPSGRHLEELYKEIETANPKQLKNIYEEFLKDVSIPLKREAELYQDAYDKLKMGKMPTKQELTKLKKELGIQLEIIDEAKADKKERKLMNTIPEEMWYSKGR